MTTPTVTVTITQPGKHPFVIVTIDDCYVILDVKVWRGRTGAYMVSLPLQVKILDDDLKLQIRDAVLKAWGERDTATFLLGDGGNR